MQLDFYGFSDYYYCQWILQILQFLIADYTAGI